MNPVKLSALENLSTLADSIYNESVRKWKGDGKKVVGYLCSYIPEEIFYAAGILPYRIGARGCKDTSNADSLMASITCSYCRSCLELALTGGYDFLDGLVYMNGCENMRRMADNWRYKAGPAFTYTISVPQRSTPQAITWYKDELRGLIEAMEAKFGTKVTEKKLHQAVELCNKTRGLLKDLYKLRRSKTPPLSGTDVHRVAIMASAMPKADYNAELAAVINDAKKKTGTSDYRARIMIIGNMLDDPNYTRIIEEAGGLVVTDGSCFGSLSFWDPVQSTEDPLDGIAKTYLGGIRCPRQPFGNVKYARFLKNMVQAFHVEGIIFERMVHCSLWACETLSLEKDAKDMNIPLLILEREYVASGLGQLKTRIQAFIEMIEGGKR